MRQPLPARLARVALSAGLALAVLAPAGVPVAAADPVVLRMGTVDAIDSLNPYQAALVESYEAYELTYDQLVGFGPNLEPIPAFAESWSRAPDGKSWTFKFRPDLKWSDGQPATSADACFSWQLNLDAIKNGVSLGLGYLDPEIKDAGVTKVECPDPTTMIATTSDPSERILQNYVPILPKHIWGKETYKTIGDADFTPPKDGSGLVGTGPYQLVEYQDKQFARFKRNPNYAGKQGFEDEIVMQFFGTNDTMFEALKKGEIDYARKLSAEQIKQLQGDPIIKTVAGSSNGWTELGFNTYGTGTGKTIKGGGPSTKALQDPAFRDALGYAIDKQKLVDSVIGGFGIVGTTQIPPVNKPWHTDPTDVRTFDIDLAKQKLDAAGYPLDSSGKRLDKQGKPISLRMVLPDYDPNFANDGQFIKDWFSQLGITVTPKTYDSSTLVDVMLPPEAGGASNKADYDLFIWDWSWGPDPNDALDVFKCDQIGYSSDSLWCNPDYDKLYDQQLVAPTDDARKAILTQMQQLWYDQAPYHILYYDDNLHAYRTDKFAGWQNQPSDGTPIFAYGILGYTLLTDAKAVPSPAPSASSGGNSPSSPGASPTAAPGSGSTGDQTSSGGTPTTLIIVIVAAVVVIGGGWFILSRRGRSKEAEEE